MVSKASDDLPEPLGPVITTKRPRGILRSRFLRLCSRAPLTCIWVTISMTANVKRIQKRLSANAFGRISRWVAFACAAAAAARANPGTDIGLHDGESLTYSVRWGFIPSVGRIKLTADALGSGRDAVVRVTTTTWTWGLARGLFPFDGRGESV